MAALFESRRRDVLTTDPTRYLYAFAAAFEYRCSC